jgi:chaperone modulatory protein CbpM
MRIEITEAAWLDESSEFSLAELAELSGLPVALLRQLVEYEALVPCDPSAAVPTFKAQRLIDARAACRLREDFDLDAPGLALVLTLLERVRELESRLRAVECLLPGPGR